MLYFSQMPLLLLFHHTPSLRAFYPLENITFWLGKGGMLDLYNIQL